MSDRDFSHITPNLKLDSGDALSADLQADVEINNTNLEEEFINQPQRFAWWASVAELAKDLVAKQKFLLERLAAQIDHAERAKALNAKPTPVRLTEKMLEHTINSNEEYQTAMLQYLEYKRQLGLLQAGREALEQRKDMLISLGANYRAEGSCNPSILKAAARDRARQAAEERRQNGNNSDEPVKRPVPKK